MDEELFHFHGIPVGQIQILAKTYLSPTQVIATNPLTQWII